MIIKRKKKKQFQASCKFSTPVFILTCHYNFNFMSISSHKYHAWSLFSALTRVFLLLSMSLAVKDSGIKEHDRFYGRYRG